MSSPESGAAHLLRGAALACLIVGLSALAHVLGGQSSPPVGMLAVLVAMLLPACVWFASRRRRPVVAGAFLGGGQAALHGAYSVLMSCPAPGAGPVALNLAGHGGHGATHMVMQCAAAAPGRPTVGGASMLVLHGVAVLVTVVVGTGAERLVRWVNDELVARLTLPPAVPAVAGRTRLGTPWRTGTVVPALCLRVGPSRRGPPPGSSLLGVLPA